MRILDVVKLAKELTDLPGATMLRSELVERMPEIDPQEERVLDEFKNFNPPLRAVPVNEAILKPTLEKCGLPEVAFGALTKDLPLRDAYYGNLDSFENPPVVYYHDHLRPCWKRFTIAKELLHLYSGTAVDSMPIDANDLILSAQESRILIPNEATELDDEIAAYYLTIEVMMPWCLREQFNRLRESGATSLQIAKAFMVPQNIVTHFISDSFDKTCNYAGLSRRLNRAVRQTGG